ncbi:hypothetical protein [Ekhidna sp.]|uniref:hypothetical protein n=1 Tax=Ekhidna sp. TaxID=2608089 RepID=UPI0032EEFDC4
MKNEDKIVELLSEMLVKQDAFVTGIDKVDKRFNGVERKLGGMERELKKVAAIQERQEQLMLKLLEIMDDDVPKFDQVINIENLKDGSVILKRHQ